MAENGIDSSPPNHTRSPAGSWQTRLGRAILSRPVGILAGCFTFTILLGCMSLSIGCRTESESLTCQEGKVSLSCEEELDVYYPTPYACPPNLEIDGAPSHYEIVEQKADHFRIRSKVHLAGGPDGEHLKWKARGPKCGVPAGAPTVIVTPPPPVAPPTNGTPVPPPEPIPVQTP